MFINNLQRLSLRFMIFFS